MTLLLLELADPAPEEAQESPHQDRPPALIQKIDSLVDTVAGLEARGARQYLQLVDLVEQLVARVAQVQGDLDGLKHAGGVCTAVHVECGAMNVEPVVPAPTQTPSTRAPVQGSRPQAWEALSPPASALLDISKEAVVPVNPTR